MLKCIDQRLKSDTGNELVSKEPEALDFALESSIFIDKMELLETDNVTFLPKTQSNVQSFPPPKSKPPSPPVKTKSSYEQVFTKSSPEILSEEASYLNTTTRTALESGNQIAKNKSYAKEKTKITDVINPSYANTTHFCSMAKPALIHEGMPPEESIVKAKVERLSSDPANSKTAPEYADLIPPKQRRRFHSHGDTNLPLLEHSTSVPIPISSHPASATNPPKTRLLNTTETIAEVEETNIANEAPIPLGSTIERKAQPYLKPIQSKLRLK